MRLATLIQELETAEVQGSLDVEVSRVRDNSREIVPGDLFVATRGLTSDGHKYIPQALERGAVALVVDRAVPLCPVPYVITDNTRRALGILAARICDWPSRKLAMVGITGTNGKTTTTYLVESILEAAGHRPAVIGTVNYRFLGMTRPAEYTTPPPTFLSETLAEFHKGGCSHAVMEVSSAALSMERLVGTEFRVAAFSNLTQDHLDVHGSMESYREAKALLFSQHLSLSGTAVIRTDDPAADFMCRAAAGRAILRVSAHHDADIRVRRAESGIGGIRASFDTPSGPLEVESPALLGSYNVDNLAMAIGIAEALGIPHDAIARGIRDLPGVPGRVQRVANSAGLDILVDYAHTPDALRNMLSAVKAITAKRLICVFGCGGDRDPTKRPLMGQAVAELADLAIVTSDNPRTEEPRKIIDMILPGVPNPFLVEVDRRIAIGAAVAEASPGDVVVIAGKGHEDYQIIGKEKHHFDDREEAARAVAGRVTFPVADILGATRGELVHGDPAAVFSRIVIDTRVATRGDLYVAIPGARFDGHDFFADAVKAGAAGILGKAERMKPHGDSVVIAVADPVKALGDIARWHRRRWNRTVIGVTGSSGKTTTKDLIAEVMATQGRVHRSLLSLNNETGVPLTLLGIKKQHDFAVVEMGMRGLGQIEYLCQFAEPNISVVLNAGVAHVGVVGDAAAIARGKSEIFRPNSVAIYPIEDERLASYAKRAASRITFGEAPGADVRLISTNALGEQGSELRFEVAGKTITTRLRLLGRHNARNAACALAVALAAGLDLEKAATGLPRAQPPPLRGQLLTIAGRHIYLDCYNANPDSMAAAIRTVGELVDARGGLAVLGDMLELGDDSTEAHKKAGQQAHAARLRVIALGDAAKHTVAGAGGGVIAKTPEDAARAALADSKPGDWILFKASRGMKLERVADAMKALGG